MKKIPFKKVLIIRVGAIGDVVHTSNTYRAIKDAHPDVEIHYLTCIDKSMIEHDPALARVWTIDYKFKAFSKYTLDYAKELKQENFDAVINLQPSFKTQWLALLAGVKKHFNYRKNNKHAVTNYWETAKRAFPDIKEFDDLKLHLCEDVCAQMRDRLSGYKRPFVILNGGNVFAKRQGRTYPASMWVELGNKIQEKYDGTIFITGIKVDAEVLKPLEQIKNAVSFVDKLSFEENSALIKNSDLLVSGDSGPLHIAAALDVDCVGLFGSMPIARTGPYGKTCRVVLSPKECAPCNHRACKYLKKSKNLYAPCMEAIETDAVMAEISNFDNHLFKSKEQV